MTKAGKYRSLASLALLRLSEGDLRALHATVTEMSPSAFMELIRDIEDEINSSIGLTLEQAVERAFPSSGAAQLYYQIDQIRRKDLRITVQVFVDMLIDGLSPVSRKRDVEIPRFDSRRGLEAWIGRLVRVFSEQEVYHAAMRVRQRSDHSRSSDWKLR